MKKLKYISLFEAFESNLLSNIFKMVNPSQKDKFKSVLENICGKLNFPMSSLSDDLFIYEDTFDEALELTVSKGDEPCDNESDTIPGEKCSGITDDKETIGTIMRTWGRGRRRVKCDVCHGSGIKPKKTHQIKYIKFWFNVDGKYILTTGTDGKERPQSSSYEGGTLDDDINNYEVEKDVPWNELRNYKNGDRFKFSDGSGIGTGVAILFIDSDGKTYMIQNFASGSTPDYSDDWRSSARFSWVVTSPGDVSGTLSLLKHKYEVDDDQKKQTDWYAFNGLIDLGNSTLSISSARNMKELLKGAHYAIALDYVKMKEKMSSLKDTKVTKTQRAESRKGAAALIPASEIKSENVGRYMKLISRSIKVTEDINSIKTLFLRVLGITYAGHYILENLHIDKLKNTFDEIINLVNADTIAPQNDSFKKDALNHLADSMEYIMRQTQEYNTNIAKNLDTLIANCKSQPERYTQRIKIVMKFIELNKVLINFINRKKLNSIFDAQKLLEEIEGIRKVYRNSKLFRKAFSASDVNYYLKNSDSRSSMSNLNYIDESEAPDIVKNLDELIKYINNE